MSTTTKLKRKLTELNSEQALLLLFLAVASFMFLRAQAWEFDAKVFPQSMAALVIIGSLLIVFQDYLPGPLEALVTETGGAFGETEDLEEDMAGGDEEEAEKEQVMPDYDRPLNPVAVTAILITLYAGLGYFFSLFLMSPLFVAAYLIWFRQPWWIVAFLSAVGLAIAYAFVTLIIVPIDRGTIVGDLLMVFGGVV